MDRMCIFFGSIFVAAGAVFFSGKGHSRLIAWKNMPQEEKDAVRIVPLCRNIGAVIFLSGLIFLAKGFFRSFGKPAFTLSMTAWMLLAGLDVLYIGKSSRYRTRQKGMRTEETVRQIKGGERHGL